MASWNAKLSLAKAMHDAWSRLNLNKYPVSSALRAAKAMEFVAQTVSNFPLCSLVLLLTSASRAASNPGLTVFPLVTSLHSAPRIMRT